MRNFSLEILNGEALSELNVTFVFYFLVIWKFFINFAVERVFKEWFV